jgi:hypothetical protein
MGQRRNGRYMVFTWKRGNKLRDLKGIISHWQFGI